jgi:hypothetical protein
MASHMKFKCPKCGGYKFGSSNCTKPFSEWMGHCHGYKDGRPCGLSWHRETQDSEVMHEETDAPNYMPTNVRANLDPTAEIKHD